ncbi:MAG: TonB-dependent receptor [Syntrophales bacterium]|nr:TonB-dependent receptor [Syntrophales bacterium]
MISITTKKLEGDRGNIEVYGGNFKTRSLSVNCRQDIKPFGVGLSAGWDKTDGFRENDDRDKKRIGTKVNYSPSKEYSFDLSLDFDKEDRGMPGLPAFPTPRSRSENETFGSSLLCQIRGLKSGTHISRFRRGSRNPDSGLETVLNSWSLMEDLKRKFGEINTGVDFAIAEVSGNKVKTKQEEKCGIHLSKDHRFENLPLTLSGGVRCAYYSEFQEVVNPEIKLCFDRDNFSIRTAAVKTNNAPSFLQRYYESSTTSPNPDLGMEKAMNYSAAFSYHPDKVFEGGITLFYNRVKDRITYVCGEGGTGGGYENFGKVTLKGTEVSCKWEPCDSLEIKPSYTYLSAKDDDTGKWLPCKPEHKAKFDIRYKPFVDLTVYLDTKYVSKQYSRADNTESVPGYFIADFRADYYLKKIRLFMKIENLFDKNYLYGDGYPAPPLTWKVGLNYEF